VIATGSRRRNYATGGLRDPFRVVCFYWLSHPGWRGGFAALSPTKASKLLRSQVDPFLEFIEQVRLASSWIGVKLGLLVEDAHSLCLTTEEQLEHVIYLGMLNHLIYPILVLDRLSEMARERIFLQSNILGHKTDSWNQPGDYVKIC
jgi:hypothetical protein